jgi:hypothetical protein
MTSSASREGRDLRVAPLALAALRRAARICTPLMDRMGAALASLVQLAFISSRSPYGVRGRR